MGNDEDYDVGTKCSHKFEIYVCYVCMYERTQGQQKNEWKII